MDRLFLLINLLLFISIVAFILGLINPRLVIFSGDKTRCRATKIYGELALLLFFLIIISSTVQFQRTESPSPYPYPYPGNDPVFLLKDTIKNLKSGQIAFNVPQEMRVDEAKLVVVRISDDLQRDLKTGLGERPETSKIKVSPFMKARLEGADFTIKLLSEEKQVLVAGRVTEWRWSVTPIEPGEQQLFLTIYARVKIPNEPEEVLDLITFQRTIKVTVNAESWLKQNWKWIVENWAAITAFFAALSVFIVAKWQWIKSLIQNRR